VGRLAPPAGARVQRYLQKQGNIPYANAGAPTNPLFISQTDYLTSLDLTSNLQTVTGATAPVYAAVGAYGLMNYVQVKVNGGRTPYTLPPYHTNIFNQVWNHDYVDGLAANPNATSSTNNIKNHLRIPLTVDPLTEKGCWYTGDTELNMSLVLTFNTAAVAFSTVNGATIQGSVDCWSEKFNLAPPDEPGGWLDEISYYHQVELYNSVQLSNGTTTTSLETDQDFQRIILLFYTGADGNANFAPADALYTTIDLVVNDKFHIIDTKDEQSMRFEMLQTYTRVLPAGTCAIDFMRLFNSRRDILPADASMAKRIQLKIQSTSANNWCDIITETVMDSQFAERWIRSAAAKAGARKAA
jgi:hypothetical protein